MVRLIPAYYAGKMGKSVSCHWGILHSALISKNKQAQGINWKCFDIPSIDYEPISTDCLVGNLHVYPTWLFMPANYLNRGKKLIFWLKKSTDKGRKPKRLKPVENAWKIKSLKEAFRWARGKGWRQRRKKGSRQFFLLVHYPFSPFPRWHLVK